MERQQHSTSPLVVLATTHTSLSAVTMPSPVVELPAQPAPAPLAHTAELSPREIGWDYARVSIIQVSFQRLAHYLQQAFSSTRMMSVTWNG